MKQERLAVWSSVVAAVSIWTCFGAIGRGPAAALRLAWPSMTDVASPTTCSVVSVVLVAFCLALSLIDVMRVRAGTEASPWPHLINAYFVGFVLALSLVTAWPHLHDPKRPATPIVIPLLAWPATICVLVALSGQWRRMMWGGANQGQSALLRPVLLILAWLVWSWCLPDPIGGSWSSDEIPVLWILLIAFVLLGGWLVPLRSAWRYVVPVPLATITLWILPAILKLLCGVRRSL